jgi:tripartite-type tricarboxylate transporter receptor subunit TctC
MKRRSLLLAAAALPIVAGPSARAQTWPTKAVRVIVAGTAGASADVIARLLADGLTRELGRPVVVDPKAGAGGAIAVNELLAAPRDGHTVLVAVNSLVSEVPHIVKLKHDMARELLPLAELARGGLVLVATPSLPVDSVAALVSHAKAQPGRLSYASYSPGTMSHILGIQFARAAGIDWVHVGYKGSTPALADVMGGHVPLMFDAMPTALPLIRSGKLRALAVSLPVRSPLLPEVPTFTELGYRQLEAVAWMGLWTTPDVPAVVRARLREASLKAMSQPGLRARLAELGFEPGTARTPDEMVAGLQADYERIGALLREAGVKPQ